MIVDDVASDMYQVLPAAAAAGSPGRMDRALSDRRQASRSYTAVVASQRRCCPAPPLCSGAS